MMNLPLFTISTEHGEQRGFVAKLSQELIQAKQDMEVLITLSSFEPKVGEEYQVRFDNGQEYTVSVTDTTFCLVCKVHGVTVIEQHFEGQTPLEIDTQITLDKPFTGKDMVILFKDAKKSNSISAFGAKVTFAISSGTTAEKPGEPVLTKSGRVISVNLEPKQIGSKPMLGSSVMIFQIVGDIQRALQLARELGRFYIIDIDHVKKLSMEEAKEIQALGLEAMTAEDVETAKDSPILFISPKNYVRTELSFLRTCICWYWAPSNKYTACGNDSPPWMPVWPGYPVNAIGMRWDGANPHESNRVLIAKLQESGWRYLCEEQKKV